MLKVTELAGQKLQEYLTQNNLDSAVRVALMNGCGGPSLGLALDEAQAGDVAAECGGVRVIIDNELLTQCGEVRVDYAEGCGCRSGFSVTSITPLPNTGGGCCGSCSSGSCGC